MEVIPGCRMTQEDETSRLDAVQEQVDVLQRHDLTSAFDSRLIPKWSAIANNRWSELVRPDGRVDRVRLRDFRRNSRLVTDLPANAIDGHALRNRLIGWRRGTCRCLEQCLDVLVARGYEDLLLKHPCPRAGHPHVFRSRGFEFTFGWARHVYALGLMRQVLGAHLPEEWLQLDIGAAYGGFESLVKREYPGSHHVLVDIPEQLLLAHYFLSIYCPSARIAGPRELLAAGKVDRDFARAYDFVLVPSVMFGCLEDLAVDLVVSFGSLGEMTRTYFDAYVDSPVYRSARFQLMINRIPARPAAYVNDITILDYPIWDRRQLLHFDACPIYAVQFLFESGLFSCRAVIPDPHFEYVGQAAHPSHWTDRRGL